MLNGIGVCDGIAIGNVLIIKNKFVIETFTPKDSDLEIKRFLNAVNEFINNTSIIAQEFSKRVGKESASILEEQISIVSDQALQEEIIYMINNNNCCEIAVDAVCQKYYNSFLELDDAIMKQRANDILDLKYRLLDVLQDKTMIDLSIVPENTILFVEHLTPSLMSQINPHKVVGIVASDGDKNSHAAILANALDIPTVLSVSDMVNDNLNGKIAIVNGKQGSVIINPSEQQIKICKKEIEKNNILKKEINIYKDKLTETADGRKVKIFGNISSPEESEIVVNYGGEGIGLFRTEIFYMCKPSIPTEEELFQAFYKTVMNLNNNPCIIRLLDIGGDKIIPYIKIDRENNPFLGKRGIRLYLQESNILKSLIRAILRVSKYGDVRILVPFVSSIEELVMVRKLISDCRTELINENYELKKHIKIGVMIETPGACLVADILASKCDFFSIGTNDLIQYIMCADRENRNVSYLNSPFYPSVLRAIKYIIECAKKNRIPVGMCGEATSNSKLIPILLALGLDEFSVAPNKILEVRKLIHRIEVNALDNLMKEIYEKDTETDVLDCLKRAEKMLNI